jgi:hypothetical protein
MKKLNYSFSPELIKVVNTPDDLKRRRQTCKSQLVSNFQFQIAPGLFKSVQQNK